MGDFIAINQYTYWFGIVLKLLLLLHLLLLLLHPDKIWLVANRLVRTENSLNQF